jgi:hypothetical protein
VGIREKINENPAIATVGTIAVIVVALILIIYQLMDSNTSPQGPTKAYYTTDDSSPEAALSALFADDISKFPPFKAPNGKDAFKAMIYTCDGGKTKWIGYLERYTPEAQQAAEAAQKAIKGDDRVAVMNGVGQMQGVMMTGVEVKKPGDKAWVKRMNSEEAMDIIMNIKCPDGTQNQIELVSP